VTNLKQRLESLLALSDAATPGRWRAGSPDMQNFRMDGIPYKALYNDIVEKEFTTEQAKLVAEAGRIYGCNSINDSQFFAASRTAVPALAKALQVAVELLEESARYECYTNCDCKFNAISALAEIEALMAGEKPPND